MDIVFDELYNAYSTCKVRKRRTANAIKFELDLEENLYKLYDDLINNNYKIDRFIYFILTKPKYREVWASDFRDRIIHHLIYNRMIEYYYPKFIHDTYACIPGRGTDAAFFRMVKFIRSESQNYKYKTYALKLDIQNFFINIDRVILWDLIKDNETIEDINDLVKQIVFHNPIDNYYFKGNKNLQQFVPQHKRLFNAKINCGLPIGNLTSQFFANIYLDQ